MSAPDEVQQWLSEPSRRLLEDEAEKIRTGRSTDRPGDKIEDDGSGREREEMSRAKRHGDAVTVRRPS